MSQWVGSEYDTSTLWKIGMGTYSQRGINRINTLDQYFKEFTEKNCKIIVITKGYVGVVNKILKDSGLSKYNIDVYGNTSTAYGKNSYDEEAMKKDYSEFLGGQEKQNEYSKGRLLVMLAEANKLKSKDCILIDDDPNEINSALQHNCEGMHVTKRQGVTLEQLQLVSSWVQQKQ
ncbi:HAD-like domain [Pseudocohnilembus persalinus]|uniref:HAD-like domain n=1 Tax=Pseudocohnilembus persalinus TaxID=266149 RepID=A0A0V0QTG6_PSEPJ|nr:HAD-like domain [Pseudocohnilembus persalinus]|eukprot:KRX05224.1 HAD-like domain [Pseudocohnilembus persalinus]